VSLNLLNIKENCEYCSTPSMSAGSLKLAIDTLYSWHKCLPWSNVWTENRSCVALVSFKNCETIVGVVAYPYPSVVVVKPGPPL